MLAGRDDALLLTEIRDALTALTVIERLVLGDRFGLKQATGVSVDTATCDDLHRLTDVVGRRWIERRALRKLRAVSISFRDQKSPNASRRSSVIVPLHGPRQPIETWPRQIEPEPEPEPPDNSLWDEV